MKESFDPRWDTTHGLKTVALNKYMIVLPAKPLVTIFILYVSICTGLKNKKKPYIF